MLVVVFAIVGLSIYARGGYHGGGYHGGRYHGGGYRGGYRGGYYNRGGWNRGGWGYGPAVGFGIGVSSAPSAPVIYNCSYATPPASYYRYQREYTDPVKDQNGYKNWLKANYNDASDQWDQFQRYLDYKACSKSSSKPSVGVSFGVGTGYGYRGGYWR